jgi:hypothetical protein
MKRPVIIALIGGGIFVALLLGVVLFISGGGASASKSNPANATGGELSAAVEAPAAPEEAVVTSEEAKAWAEARAADTPSAYRVYLAAYPEGAFSAEAQEAIDRKAEARATKAAATRTASAAPRRPTREEIAADCRAYVDATLPAPSRVGRTVGGAAGGCAAGLLAGGDDDRNCVVGAVVGGATGAITAENRERRRMREVEHCIASGGPPQ